MPIVRRGHGSVTLRDRLQAQAGRRLNLFQDRLQSVLGASLRGELGDFLGLCESVDVN